jgi:hypothetical protein
MRGDVLSSHFICRDEGSGVIKYLSHSN